MDSITSMKTSFFLYLIPSDLQETALVTVVGTLLLVTSSLAPSCVMYLESVAEPSASVFARLGQSVCLLNAHSCRILLSVV